MRASDHHHQHPKPKERSASEGQADPTFPARQALNHFPPPDAEHTHEIGPLINPPPPLSVSPFPVHPPGPVAPPPAFHQPPLPPRAAHADAADLAENHPEMAMALRRLAGVPGSPSPAAAAAALLLRPALTRPISTGFREERDTFGPIQVPNDKCVVPSSPLLPPAAALFG